MLKKLEKLGLNIDSLVESKLNKFMCLFQDYNEKVNLVSKRDSKYLFEKHIYDSLALNLFLDKYHLSSPLNLLDIGTGGGFPSIPLAIFFDNIEITAVDSISKKIKFIEYIKEELNLKNLKPLCCRIESLNVENQFDICVSRAVAELRIILEYAIPYTKEGAFFVAYKSIKTNEEIFAAKNALNILKSKIVDKIEYSLPLDVETKRILVIIQKNESTKKDYPRKNGIIIKKPL